MNPKIELSKYCVPGVYSTPKSISNIDASCPGFYVISKIRTGRYLKGLVSQGCIHRVTVIGIPNYKHPWE